MSEVNLGRFGVVVLAEFHNPSILTKDYLIGLNLIKQEEIKNFLHTPSLSLIEFGSYRFYVEPGRLEVREEGPAVKITDSRVQIIANTYLESLPKTPYKATGINFRATKGFESIKSMQEAIASLLSRENASLRAEPFSSALCGLRFIYTNAVGRHTLTIEPDYEKKSPEGTITYNLHVLTSNPEEIKSVIARSQDLFDEFASSVQKILG